jgi:hypothetical protein
MEGKESKREAARRMNHEDYLYRIAGRMKKKEEAEYKAAATARMKARLAVALKYLLK